MLSFKFVLSKIPTKSIKRCVNKNCEGRVDNRTNIESSDVFFFLSIEIIIGGRNRSEVRVGTEKKKKLKNYRGIFFSRGKLSRREH